MTVAAQFARLETRRALYYPNIHPRDGEWVKATVLAFGQLNRIVPDGFPLDDITEVKWLRDEMGPDNEPIVCSISPEWPDIEFAQQRLFSVLQTADETVLQGRFGQAVTKASYGPQDLYEIHEGKVHDPLLEWLRQRELTWVSPKGASRGSPGIWWALHPELGAALGSVMTIAAARHKGLDVVTESVPLHGALAALDEQSVLGGLIQPAHGPAAAVVAQQVVDHLSHVLMTTMST